MFEPNQTRQAPEKQMFRDLVQALKESNNSKQSSMACQFSTRAACGSDDFGKSSLKKRCTIR